MSEEIKSKENISDKIKREHILCVNWYIFSWLWRKVYKEISEQSNIENKKIKLRLSDKFPIEITQKSKTNDGDKEPNTPKKIIVDLNFYGLFGINYSDYDEFMVGNDTAVSNETPDGRKKVRKLSEITHLHPSIFTGEECLIPINNITSPKLYKYAEARFLSADSYDYREESKTVDKLIQEFLYLPNMLLAIAFIKSRGEIKPGIDSIGRNKAFLESTKYKELLRSDISTLGSYKKCLEEHLEKVNSCIVFNKNKNF
ncbi:hypothetical protein ACOAOT_16805 [Lacrimispora sp. AGF001]|uniref:hypothetical protein n=1 Tax=Lacrimispora sp. AGF001 TaxID=3401631 RepID=UPI003B4363BA